MSSVKLLRRQARVVALSGDYDETRFDELRRTLEAEVDEDSAGLVIDLTDATYLHSRAVDELIRLRAQLASSGLAFATVAPAKTTSRGVLRTVGLTEHLRCEETRTAALAALGAVAASTTFTSCDAGGL